MVDFSGGGVSFVGVLEILRLDQGVNAVHLKAVDEIKAFGAVIVFILKKSDFVFWLDLLQKTVDPLDIGFIVAAEDTEEGIVKDDDIKLQTAQVRKTQFRVPVPDVEPGVSGKGGDVFGYRIGITAQHRAGME